ncbi:MAG: hypothetical protein L0332_30845 [Chloroflexi bacterium]|nr:hypothetical protein [Chloroflexota bacterium]MCI0731098.1 hypothetical protein [Chloroflexota bacterium]
MSKEKDQMPEWARRERQRDLVWIRRNVEVFWLTARTAFQAVGRGVIVVDTTVRPWPGAGHPFVYLSQQDIAADADEDTMRMIQEYDPATEIVVLLLKPKDRTSTYRIQARQRSSGESNGNGTG